MHHPVVILSHHYGSTDQKYEHGAYYKAMKVHHVIYVAFVFVTDYKWQRGFPLFSDRIEIWIMTFLEQPEQKTREQTERVPLILL